MAVVISRRCDGPHCEESAEVTDDAQADRYTIDSIPDRWIEVNLEAGKGLYFGRGLTALRLSFHGLECLGAWAHSHT